MVASTNMFIQNILSTKMRGVIPIIAEIKPYSVKNGDLLGERSIKEIAHEYVASNVPCISVVTGKWYHGTLGILEELAKEIDIPILRKDFITSRVQVKISKEIGASAVLLTKKLLIKDHLEKLIDYSLSIDLIPFVEVTDKIELEELNFPSGSIVAINNRDITNKETDNGSISRSIKLLNIANKCGADLCISASGISTHDEASSLFLAGFDALLIGTSLLQADNIQEQLSALSSFNKK